MERPRDDNDIASAETPEDILKIFLIYASSESIGKRRVDAGWEDILREENAGAFADFLNRLFKTAEFNHPTLQATLKDKFQALMTTVLGLPEFRRLCFKIVTDATESCGDRIALVLNHMKFAELDHLSSAGVYGEPALRDIGIDFFRQSELNKISEKKYVAHKEVFKSRGLSEDAVDTAEISGVTDADLDQALFSRVPAAVGATP